MIIFLSEEHKKHLEILQSHSVPVLVDFCKLALDFIHNGPNNKRYAIAAQKLNVSEEVIENVVNGLVYLVIECCKQNLRDGDFRASLVIANFSSEHTDVLLKFYKNKKAEVSTALNRLSLRTSSYQDLEWRFEVQVASRADTDIVLKPGALLDFILQTPKSLTDSDENASLDDTTNTTDTTLNLDSTSDALDRLRITRSASQATAASQCDNHIEHVLVQCDLPNLVNLTSKLDQALVESKSTHVKKMYRNFQKK